MLRLAMRRLPSALLLAWGVTSLAFVLVQLVPGRPLPELSGPDAPARSVAHLRALLGAERPVWERYLSWLGGLMHGELGLSLEHRRPVRTLVGEAAANTLALAGTALVCELLLGTAVGAAATWRSGGWFDRAVTAAATVVYSLPSFWLGLFLVWLFPLRLGWLPVSQMNSPDAATFGPLARTIDTLRHLVLPCLALTLPAAGGVALYVREEMRALRDRPFVAAARARGAGPSRVVLAHLLRGSLLPVVQILGLSLPGLVGGSVVVEFLFAWPGMGRLAYNGLLARDEPVVLGCTLIGSLAVVVGSLAADLAAAAVDPRTARDAA